MRPPSRWRISPALPASANVLLALLWLFSAYGGWGDSAFCADMAGTVDVSCAHDYARVIRLSLIAVVPAALFAVAGWALLRNRPDDLDVLLSATAGLWLVAEAVLFIGGLWAS